MANRIIANPLEDIAPAIYPPPTFEAFALALQEGSTLREARKLVTEVLGRSWQLKPFGDDNHHFEIVKKSGTLTVNKAWEKTYLLQKQKEVIYAEPLFKAAVSSRGDWGDDITVNGRAINRDGPVSSAEAANLGAILCGGTFDLPESTQDPEWSVKQVKVIEAWNHFFGGNPARVGEGIVVGHPDTGYTNHPEIVDNLLADLGFDFVDDDTDAKDELDWPGRGLSQAQGMAPLRLASSLDRVGWPA